MLLFVRLLAVSIISVCGLCLININIAKGWIRFWRKGQRAYIGGAISAVCAILLLVAAPRCALPWIPITVGFISIVKAVVIVACGPKKFLGMLDSLMEMKVLFLRLFMLMAIAIGFLLLYSV